MDDGCGVTSDIGFVRTGLTVDEADALRAERDRYRNALAQTRRAMSAVIAGMSPVHGVPAAAALGMESILRHALDYTAALDGEGT